MPFGRRAVRAQPDRLGIFERILLGRCRHVLGHVDNDGPRTTAVGQHEGFLHDAGNVFDRLNHKAVLHNRTRHTNHVGLLEEVGAGGPARHVTADDHHGD